MSQYVHEIGKSRSRYRALILLVLGISVLVLGYVGFSNQLTGRHSPLDIIYRSGELFAYKAAEDVAPGNWPLEIARWLAPGVTLFALYEFIKALLSEQIQAVRLMFARNHVIVCGLGLLGPEIAARFRERGHTVVIIEKDPVNRSLKACRETGAITLIGDATDPAMLNKARLSRARYLFAVTGDDGRNSEIAVKVHRLAVADGAGGFACFVHMVDGNLCSLLRGHQMALDNDRFTLELFNIYQMAGLSVLKEYPPFPVLPVPPDTHLAIVGTGKMGQDLIFHVVKRWKETYGNAKKIRITVIDRAANLRVETLKFLYPSIGRYCDLVPLQADLSSPDFRRGLFMFEDGRVTVTGIYVCLNDQSLGLSAALDMNHRLEEHAIRRCEKKPEVSIVVRTGKEGLTTLFEDIGRTGGAFGNIVSFPLIGRACGVDNITGGLNETIARAIHDDYVLIQKTAGVTEEKNPSIKPWDRLDETLKVSNRNQAVHIREKLLSIGCDIVGLTDWEQPLFTFETGEIEVLSEIEHRRFVEERRRQGWKQGPVKDSVKKITPYLVPYADLEESIKELDRNAIRALPAALARADLKIVRRPREGPGPAMEKEIACAGR